MLILNEKLNRFNQHKCVHMQLSAVCSKLLSTAETYWPKNTPPPSIHAFNINSDPALDKHEKRLQDGTPLCLFFSSYIY